MNQSCLIYSKSYPLSHLVPFFQVNFNCWNSSSDIVDYMAENGWDNDSEGNLETQFQIIKLQDNLVKNFMQDL